MRNSMFDEEKAPGTQFYGERIGRQQVYNTLLSMYLDARDKFTEARRNGQMDALVWAAMAAWDLYEDEAAATERVAEDLQERLAARAD